MDMRVSFYSTSFNTLKDSHPLFLFQAMEEGESGDIDNTDFEGTDIPSPYHSTMPKDTFLDSDEDVREKGLSWALDDSIDGDKA